MSSGDCLTSYSQIYIIVKGAWRRLESNK